MSSPFDGLSSSLALYIAFSIAMLFLKKKRAAKNSEEHSNIPSSVTQEDWYDIQHFMENLSLLSDHDMRDLLDELLEKKECSMELRMKANDFILRFQNAQNSFHNPQAKLLLQNLCVRMNRLLGMDPSSDTDWQNAIEQTDKAYVAYRSHFYNLTGQ